MTLQSDKHSYGMTALRSLTEVLIKELDPRETDRVLDVGTGSGQLAVVLCKLVPKGFVTGVDPARDRLGVAKDSERLLSPHRTSHLAAETTVAATPVHL